MVKQKSVKGTKDQPIDPVYKMDKFFGEGIMFKCKLFGSLKVAGPRGDEICAGAIGHLKQHAKQLNKEQKLHKQRIFLNISLKGIRIIDQQSRKLEHAHVVHKISYISHDKEDRRTFGYIVSLPEGYHLFAFKAEKNAGIITANLKELFHVVYLKHKHEKQAGIESGAEVQEAKQNEIQGDTEPTEFKDENPYAVPKKNSNSLKNNVMRTVPMQYQVEYLHLTQKFRRMMTTRPLAVVQIYWIGPMLMRN